LPKILTTIAAGASLGAVAENAAAARDVKALGDLSLRDLMSVEVEITSVRYRNDIAKASTLRVDE